MKRVGKKMHENVAMRQDEIYVNDFAISRGETAHIRQIEETEKGFITHA